MVNYQSIRHNDVAMAITAVILNWNRPFNLKRLILPRLAAHPLITEIILSHGKRETQFEFSHKQCAIVHFDDHKLNAEYGLSLRFLRGQGAKNECLLYLDDDVLIAHSAVNRLYQAYCQERLRMHGLYGRAIDTQFNYRVATVYGDVPLVITRFMMMDKSHLDNFFTHAHVVADLLPLGRPHWNGEDIFMSLLVTQQTGLLPRAYKFSKLNLRYSELSGISANFGSLFARDKSLSHRQYRTLFTRECIKRLELEPQMSQWLKAKHYYCKAALTDDSY